MATRLALFLLLIALLAPVGCRKASAPDPEDSSATQGLQAEELPADLEPDGSPGSPSGGSASSPDPSPQESGTTTGVFQDIGTTSDPSGDAGLRAPGYADIVRVTIQDNGSSARIIVDLAAAVPTKLPESEVMGVGVDLFKAETQESDYQVFGSGSDEGWEAFLHTPQGLRTFTGRFFVGSSRIVFELRWADLGSITGTRFSSFVDWSRSTVGPIALSSSDRAPDRSRASFRR